MKIQITYYYSTLDKKYIIGIEDGFPAYYIKWVWYHLGATFRSNTHNIRPFEISNRTGVTNIKDFAYIGNSIKQAEQITNFIIKLTKMKKISVTQKVKNALLSGKSLTAKQIIKMGVKDPYTPISVLVGKGMTIQLTGKKYHL